jgi:nucleolar protein 56
MSHIAGPELAAKLVAQSGGLQRMAMFPASTIQVLGAEKALFKHLKSGSRPPKHGLIFQHASIGMAPKKVRGKISRCLAAKLTIAAKADAFSHNFIAEKLKAQFEAQVKRIMAKQGASEAGKPERNFQPRRN